MQVQQQLLTIDILPTMADLLHLPLPGNTDGHSALSKEYPALDHVRALGNGAEAWYTLPLVTSADKTQSIQHKAHWFGSGDSRNIFTFSPYAGMPVQQLPVATPGQNSASFRLNTPEAYRQVNPDGRFIPAQIEGTISSPSAHFPDSVLVAVNDVVWATYPCIRQSSGLQEFSVMVPESSFKPGNNKIRLFGVTQDTGKATITELNEQP
jgi:hypothetical protein